MTTQNKPGTPDLSFGGNGVADLSREGDGTTVTALTVSTAGKVAKKLGDSSFVTLIKDSEFILTKRLENGGPNLSFGNSGSGYSIAQFEKNTARNVPGQIHLVDDEKKILVIGQCEPDQHNDMCFIGITCFNADGTLDNDFGFEGSTVIRFNDIPEGHKFSKTASAVQPDGKILVAISASVDTRLARLNSNGTLDDSFGAGGVVNVHLPETVLQIEGILVQIDTSKHVKIVVGGTAIPAGRDYGFAARFNAQGQLDDGDDGRPVFGDKGYATLEIAERRTVIRAVIQDSEQNIYLAGSSPAAGNSGAAVLASFTADGEKNPGFNKGEGPVLTRVPDANFRWLGAVATTKHLNVRGYAAGPGIEDIKLARFLLDGSRDADFGEDDNFTTLKKEGEGTIAAQPNGRLLLTQNHKMHRFLG
ncbi:delta-60 repeat domain-containing protein [Pseudomonas frederiksbergensis]|uniref:delta-60 repeat domain-containing protein n=1 Tax=Pseudomonas frederiksbergensis TaxID=104087 RepID=UPI003D208C93